MANMKKKKTDLKVCPLRHGSDFIQNWSLREARDPQAPTAFKPWDTDIS